MKLFTFVLCFTFSICVSFAQTYVDVAELTIKVGPAKTEELLYGFAEGDQIIFSFEEAEGRPLKEVEIVEYPENSKFMDYETKKIETKSIQVPAKNVYKFKFRNSHLLKGRVCRIKIQRIPASPETKNFNTAIKYVSEQDTTYKSYTKDVVVGYDTLYQQKTKLVLEEQKNYEELILDKSQRVNSSRHFVNGNKTFLFFNLPLNYKNKFESLEVKSWIYWVGVGEESNKAWQQNKKALEGAINLAAGAFFTPIGAYAFGAASSLLLPNNGEDVIYALVDEANKNLFVSGYDYKGFDFGKGVVSYKLFSNPALLQGQFFIVMSNDNILHDIDVNVKVSAILEYKKYKEETYTEMKIKPIEEKKIITEPIITTRKFPATADYIRK